MRPPSSSHPAPTRLRVRRPSDFLALIPYLLGFHPEESLVVVFAARGRVLLTARLDLPPPALAGSLAEQLADLSVQHRADEVVLAAYGEGADAREVLQRVLDGLTVPVREALLVSGGRWWSLTCPGSCCPPGGTPWDAASHPLAAEAVYAGLAVQPSRRELQRQVAGPSPAQAERLAELVAATARRVSALSRPERARLMAETVTRCCAEADGPPEGDCVLLAVLAGDVVVRDVAWVLVQREEVADHLRVWSRTVETVPPGLALGALGLLGVTAWIAGRGALQNCCAERMEQLDPTYTLTDVLGEISDRALPPRYWDELSARMRGEVSALAGLSDLH